MKKLNLLLGLCFLFAVGIASASTVELTEPDAGDPVTGTYNFTATVTFTDNFNVTNCSFGTTDDGVFLWSVRGNVTSQWNSTSTTSLTASASTTVTVTCYNYSSGNSISDTSTLVYIDNTNPTCSCGVDANSIEIFEPIFYDCQASSDNVDTGLTYSCVATYNDATTETETSQRGSFEDTNNLGEVSIACTVTDDASLTNTCSTMTAVLQGSDNDGGGTQQIGVTPTKGVTDVKKVGIAIAIVFIILVVVIIIVVVATQKPKRKR